MSSVTFAGLRLVAEREAGAPVQDARLRAWALAMPSTVMSHVSAPDSEEAGILALLGALSALSARATLSDRLVLATWTDSEVGTLPFLDMRMMQFVSDDELSDAVDAWPWRLHLAEERSRPGLQGVQVDFPLYPNVWHLDVAWVAEDWCEEYGVGHELSAVMAAWGMPHPDGPGEIWPGEGEEWLLAGIAHAEAQAVRLLGESLCGGVASNWVDPKLV